MKRRQSTAFCWSLALFGAWLLAVSCPVPSARAQEATVVRVGGFDFTLAGSLALNYSSNVEQEYPDERNENYQKDDFYWVPSLTLSATPVRINPVTAFTLGGTIGYEKYMERKDLDTETYNLALGLNSTLRYVSLSAAAILERSTENEEDETYRPGGYARDPQETQEVSFGATWSASRLTISFTTDYTRERHDYKKYQSSDQDELTYDFDVRFALTQLFSAYYTHSYDWTHTILDDKKETEVDDEFGIALNHSIGRHPVITASVGMDREITDEKGDKEKKMRPVFDISVTDAYDITKYVSIAAGLTWSDDNEEDEVDFTYYVNLTHRLPPYITQTLAFSQEPLDTLGSNVDTASTSFTYTLEISPFFVKGLAFNGSADYTIDKPLDKSMPIEYTTTYNAGLAHTRTLSRKLSRILSYNYSWENSNFHSGGANDEHLVTYKLNYLF